MTNPRGVDELASRAIAHSEGLQATAVALGRALRSDEVAELAVREGLARLGAGRGVVGVLEPDGHTVRTVAAVGFDHDVLGGWPTFDVEDEAPLSEAMRLREPLIIQTADEIRRRYPAMAGTTGEGGPAVVVPLIYEDRAIGGLYFRYLEPRIVAESDKPYFSALGRLCASALERAHLYEAETHAWAEAHRAEQRIAFLASVGEALSQAPNVELALTSIARLAVPAIADWASVFLLDAAGEIRNVALHHRDPERLAAIARYLEHRPPRLDDAAGAGAAIRTGQVELHEDPQSRLADETVPEDARAALRESGISSVIYCPLAGDTAVFGVLVLATTGDRRFTSVDKAFAEELGRRVGTAVDKVRLNARLTERLRGQEAVARLGQLALLHQDLEPLFEAAATDLAEVLDADITAIMVHVPEKSALRIIAGTGWRDGIVGETLISDAAQSHSGFALVADGPVVSGDYENEKRFRPSSVVRAHGARSGVTTPILGPNGPWGVLGVHSRSLGHFDDDQVALLDTYANVLGSAVSRQRAESQLRDREERLELALSVARTGFWEWNVRTGRILWSDEICRLHGVPPGTELNGLDEYLQFVHPADRERVRRENEEAAVTGTYDTEFRIVVSDGAIRWTHATARVFKDERGEPVRVVGVARDVTERTELEAERLRIAEAERRAGELNQAFIGVLSHELRTPITSIFAGSKLLRRMDDSDPQRHELTADIEAEAERLFRLTEDLLVLTRVERGGLELSMEPVALPRLLERVIASEQERWPRTTIELEVDGHIPIVLGDNTYIEQLVRNLVGNAAKYGPEGGTIRVVATAGADIGVESFTEAAAVGGATDGANPEDVVAVRVLDEGPGLTEQDAAHLFELFYRSPNTSKKAPGAGIGLFVCDHLARALGGQLWARNRDDGLGSEFGFTLRRYATEAPLPADPVPATLELPAPVA